MIGNRYFVIEKPTGWTARQFKDGLDALMADLQVVRTPRYTLPNDVLHYGWRDDGGAVVVDGLVDTERLQPAVVADTMANAVGLDMAGRLALRTEMQTRRVLLAGAGAARDYVRLWNGGS